LKQSALAMNNYDSAKKKLPPGTKYWWNDDGSGNQQSGVDPRGGSWWDDHGWYAYLTPYIEEIGISKAINFDKSFSDTSNYNARIIKVKMFECPSDGMMLDEGALPANFMQWARWRANYAVNFGNTNYGQTNQAQIDANHNLGVGTYPQHFKGA